MLPVIVLPLAALPEIRNRQPLAFSRATPSWQGRSRVKFR